MANADDVALKTAKDLLDQFEIPFERLVLRARAADILDDYSRAIGARLTLFTGEHAQAWLAFCREALARAYARQAGRRPANSALTVSMVSASSARLSCR